MLKLKKKDRISICGREYVLIERLAGGFQFRTWKVERNNSHYVAKLTDKTDRALRELRTYLFLKNRNYPDRYYAELIDFDHLANIIKTNGKKTNLIALLLKYYPFDNLSTFIKNANTDERQKIAIKLKRRVLLLHKAGIIHGDLRENNIIALKTNRGIGVRLIDFGLSKFIEKGDKEKENIKLNRLINRITCN